MDQIDVTIIGGGIVGCAVAAEAAGRGLTTVLLEQQSRLATGITARNSEVVHGGMYYPSDTLKARFCVRGRRMLKEFCLAANVPYQECGKLIVAVTEAEEPQLEHLLQLGQANGVEDLSLIDGQQLAQFEPHIQARVALYSPRTGIVSAEGAARAYAALAVERGAQILTDAPVTALERTGAGWHVTSEPLPDSGREGWSHQSRLVVNAAGLYSDRVAELTGIDATAAGYELHWVKGNYFSITPAHAGMISRLVYPVPPADDSTLGVHVCVDLGGQLRLGPDTEPIDKVENYQVEPARREAFYRSASTFLPFLEREDLECAMAGIRPKRIRRGFADFVVTREDGDQHGLINLIGIDSPGLTSSPAIAEEVGRLLVE